MKIHRTKEQWKDIILKQSESNKSVRLFCKEKSIHPTFFYRKKKEFENAKQEFIKVPVKISGSVPICIKIKNIIIEPKNGTTSKKLLFVIRTVLKAVNA